MSKDGNMNLEINGRLFPSWLLENFKHMNYQKYLEKKGKTHVMKK